ncbi:MAG: methyl-accepting chemotaxis protein [Bacillota bacterium]|nr:methyl-accepting chemotaxis protein [Bacillota bacterium]
MSLAKKNILFYVIAITVVFALCMTIVYFKSKSQILNMGGERADSVIKSLEATISAGHLNIKDADFKKTLQLNLDELKKKMPELEDFTIYNISQKKAIASSTKENVNKEADPEDLDAAQKDKTVILVSKEGGELIVDVTAPLHINGKINLVCGVAFSMNEEMQSVNNLLIQIIILSVAALATVIFLIWFFGVRKTSKQLNHLMSISNEISKGNLKVQAIVNTKDEIGQLSQNINNMSLALSNIISNVNQNSKQISTFSQSLSEVTNATAVSIEEAAKTIDELATGVSDQAQKAEIGTDRLLLLAKKINDVMEDSTQIKHYTNETNLLNENVKEAIIQLEEKLRINNDVSYQIEKNVKELYEKSSSVSHVVDTIQTIAEQTNLLALNAAIEAARAGEQGKGFSVVADEIRKLAEQTSESTHTIGQIVKEIQNEINTTKGKIDIGTSSLSNVNEKLDNTTKAFEAISKAVKNSIENIDKLTLGIQKINIDKDEVVSLIQEITSISENNAASAKVVSYAVDEQSVTVEEIASTADNLKEIALKLDEVIGGFKI